MLSIPAEAPRSQCTLIYGSPGVILLVRLHTGAQYDRSRNDQAFLEGPGRHS